MDFRLPARLSLALLAAAIAACNDRGGAGGERRSTVSARPPLASVELVSIDPPPEAGAPVDVPVIPYKRLGAQIQAGVREVSLPGSLTYRVGPVPAGARLSFGHATTWVGAPEAAVDLEVAVATQGTEEVVYRTAMTNVAHRDGPPIARVHTRPESADAELLADGDFGAAWTSPTERLTMIQLDLAEAAPLTAFAMGSRENKSRGGIPSRIRVTFSSDGKSFRAPVDLERKKSGQYRWHLLPGEPVRSLRIWILATHDRRPAVIDEILLSTERDVGTLPNQLGRWSRRSLDLSGYRDRTLDVTFRFGPLRSPGLPAIATGLLSGPTIDLPRRHNERNVVLISIDTVRADRLSAFGYERETTPFLDEIVQSPGAVRFTNVRSTSTWTPPSHLALMTGKTPFQLNIHASHQRMIDGNVASLDASVPTLASILRARGYKTVALSSAGGTEGGLGLRSGFDVYSQPWSMLADKPLDYFGELISKTERAERWLEENRTGKFFLFLHTYVAHAPYKGFDFAGCDESAEAEERCERYRGKLHRAANRLRRGTEWGRDRAMMRRLGVYDAQTMSDLYDGGLRLVDEFLRTVITALDRLDLRSDTLVVITSDHGEAFAEHPREHFAVGHGQGLYDEYLKVPLLFLVPGLDDSIRSDVPASLVDVVPTVLDLLEIESGASFEGNSLTPVIRGEENLLDSRPIFYEVLSDEKFEDYHFIAASKKNFKILANVYDLFDGNHELYDLAVDPSENNDIGADRPAIAQDLLSELDRHLSDVFRGMVVLDMSTLGRAGDTDVAGTVTFSHDVRLFDIAARTKQDVVSRRSRNDKRTYEIELKVGSERRLIAFRPPSDETSMLLEIASDQPCEIRTPFSTTPADGTPVALTAKDIAVEALPTQSELPRGGCSIGAVYLKPGAEPAASLAYGGPQDLEQDDRERILEQMRALGYVD